MGYIDLHIHSNISDGTLSPAQITALALDKGLDAIALTDHDTTAGIDEAMLAAIGSPLEIIPGVELSCIYESREIHILGYYIDHKSAALTTALKQLRQLRENRNQEMIRRFCAKGIQITQENLIKENPKTVITRAHFARVLTEKGYTTSMNQAFKQYLQYDGSFCIRQKTATPESTMELLISCGATPVIAHPYQYKLSDRELERMIQVLCTLGLQGIEVYHSSQNQNESRKLKELCNRYGLLPTGGSDFHGSNKPDINLGTGRGGLSISHLLLKDLKAARASFP